MFVVYNVVPSIVGFDDKYYFPVACFMSIENAKDFIKKSDKKINLIIERGVC